jgi:hypothetical protein
MDINFAIYGRKQQIDLICRAEETNIDEAREGKQGHFSSEEKNYYFLCIFFLKKNEHPLPRRCVTCQKKEPSISIHIQKQDHIIHSSDTTPS